MKIALFGLFSLVGQSITLKKTCFGMAIGARGPYALYVVEDFYFGAKAVEALC